MKYLWCFLVVIAFSCTTKSPSIKYTIAPEPWSEGMGSQRAVIRVDKPADAVCLDLLWRRHDPEPENRKFLVVNENTGDTIENIHRIYVDNEQCKIVFGPVQPGKHYFYYLPFKTDSKWGWYRYGYLDPENSPDPEWVSNNGLNDIPNTDSISQVQCSEIQCRSAFDSFYPMEVIPTTVEKQNYIDQNPGDYLLFPEDREFPIRMKDEIPYKWIVAAPGETFSGEACLNEYYVFQLGLFAVRKNIQDVKIKFSDLSNGKHKILSSLITCFNTGGVDPYGNEFSKIVDVGKDSVQALWIGIDIAESVNPGLYTGHVIVAPGNSEEKRIEVNLKVNKTLLTDRGDSELWRHSRLRWLNSTLGIDSQPVEPYTAIKQVDQRSFDLYGRKVKLAESGLPNSIRSWDHEILSRPINMKIRIGNNSMETPVAGYSISDKEEGMIKWGWETDIKDIEVAGEASLDFDGTLNYEMVFTAKEDVNVTDIWLEIPLKLSIGQYIKGMGFRGNKVPMNHTAKWEGPHDSFWIGNTSGGLHCELRGSEYHGPMRNLFPINYPDSWYNGDNGYLSLVKSKNEVVGSVHSGKRALVAGEKITFEFSLLITPVKERNTKAHFNNRYYHNARDPWPPDAALDGGVRIINVHHGNKFNPYINYPFIATEEMKGFVDHWHEKGLKVKIYYTLREITNHVTEIWALRSLGDEVLRGSKGSNLPWLHGGGYPWLIEHFVSDYTRAWYHPFQDGFVDAAILTAPGDTRLYNYYVEGLRWLTKNIKIDGLYLDDVTYDRRILKRMRKVMEAENPGCIIDLHSHDDFSGGPAIQYAEFFPYVDKVWFGEGFEYNEMSPENWLVEVSGIPFGLMGDMLQGGGNRWLGMLFGMSVRLPWTSEETKADPRPVWKVWDEFEIANSEMIGFWEDCPVKTTHPDVLATVYRKDEQALIAIGSWAKNSEKIKLVIDWEEIGINKEQAVLVAPEVEDFQPNMSFDLDAAISIEPTKGWLIFLSESKK